MNTASMAKDKRALVIGCLVAACVWRLDMQDDLCISGQNSSNATGSPSCGPRTTRETRETNVVDPFHSVEAIGCITGVHASLERSNIQSTTPLFFTV